MDFFRRGGLTPVYHDRFPKLSEELRDTLANGDETAANLLSMLNKVCVEYVTCCGLLLGGCPVRSSSRPGGPWTQAASKAGRNRRGALRSRRVVRFETGVDVLSGAKKGFWRTNTGRS